MHLRPGHFSLEQLQAIHAGGVALEIDDEARSAIATSAAVVQRAAAGQAAVYGVNTGFGKLASTRISEADLATLQLNLIRSHSVGVGEPLAPAVVRLVLALKAGSLARGASGVRQQVVDMLLAVLRAGLVPFIPSQGSVGASGDLAPLAHMTLALLGEGEFLVTEPGHPSGGVGERRPAAAVLKEHRIEALRLQAKEGLALINGTQVSTALALHALFAFEPVLESALVIGALTVDAARGSDGPFDPRIHALRGQPGQIDVAQYYRALLAGSAIRASHKDMRPQTGAPRRPPPEGDVQPWQSQMLDGDDRVQDPYCLRCQPQVVGACLDQLRHAALVLLREANAVTDNPLVFVDGDAAAFQAEAAEPALPGRQRRPPEGERRSRFGGGAIVSGGNFHAEPVALACDAMAVAIAEVGAISERRIAMLIDANVSRLPPFLTANAGLNSGFMIAHVTAAALASENKSLAHPASVDSLPTSANQEDHVSMATFAARRLQPMIDNVAHVLAIEWLAAAQGIEFLRPLRSSPAIEAALALLRAQVPALGDDRYLAPDIERAHALVRSGAPSAALRGVGGPALWVVAG